jgi:hypothetical protein
LGINALAPRSTFSVPLVHGGDGSIKEEALGSFAFQASASTIAKFIGTNCEIPWQTIVKRQLIVVNSGQQDWWTHAQVKS